MSPLTKVFVVLLVITSILVTSAAVVYVNALQPVAPQLASSAAQLQAARDAASTQMAAAQRSQEQFQSEQQAHEADRKADAAAITSLQSSLNDARVQIAQLQAEKATRDATINTLNSNLTLTTGTVNKLQQQVSDLRNSNDKLIRQTEEFSRRTAELTALNETLNNKLSDTQEKLASSQDNLQKMEGALRNAGGNPDDILNGNNTALGAPSINGRVTDKSVIEGNTYVTISVGSADGVQKGMQFNVVDGRNGQFLGIVTVDTVDTNDAIGRLQGDPSMVDQVRSGDEVKTQLRGG